MVSGLDGLFFQCIVGIILARYHAWPIVKGWQLWQETKELLSPIFSGYWLMHFFANAEPCSSFR
jgi:hypothetical protein